MTTLLLLQSRCFHNVITFVAENFNNKENFSPSLEMTIAFSEVSQQRLGTPPSYNLWKVKRNSVSSDNCEIIWDGGKVED